MKSIEQDLLFAVQSSRASGSVVAATLTTDEKVFARITDGIYREPASALRELIANAYDADATEVRISTDAPRFSQIVVRDNGHGLTEDALVHVICHIGGSLKRSAKGGSEKFNVANSQDSMLSPGGRKLIGKLGIGLFSVSQLTHHLIIVTKVKGEPFRRVCDILLLPQTDIPTPKSGAEEEVFITGKALIKSVPADDVDSQGTEITLLDIRPFVRESLQSQALWNAIEPEMGDESEIDELEGLSVSNAITSNVPLDTDDFYERPPIPTYHIGRVSKKDPTSLITAAIFPWTAEDNPDDKFKKLVDGVRGLANFTSERIRLSEVLDTYFRTLWTLSLSVPLPYVKTAPFNLTGKSSTKVLAISNKGNRSPAIDIALGEDESIAQRLGVIGDQDTEALPFSVIVDDISLKRPLEFDSKEDSSPVPPLMFIGKMRSELSSVSDEYSGGPIEFEAYFYWQHKVAPADHNGVMVRINGASGILFDDHFLRYQISELTRLRQITAEIYVSRGLDAALNIDRESFNIAHTHYQVLKKWIHHALRQVMSAQKRVSGNLTQTKLEGGLSKAAGELSEIVSSGKRKDTTTQLISFAPTELLRQASEGLVFDRATVFSPRNAKKLVTKKDKLNEVLLEKQIHAVASVLQDYSVFDSLTQTERDELLRKIVAIFSIDLRK